MGQQCSMSMGQGHGLQAQDFQSQLQASPAWNRPGGWAGAAGSSPLSPAIPGLGLAFTPSSDFIIGSDWGSMALVWPLGLKKKKTAGAPERPKPKDKDAEV